MIRVTPPTLAVLLIGLLAPAGSMATVEPPARKNPQERSDTGFEITVLSSRPDMVTGGDALVQIDVPRNVQPRRVIVELNDIEVTDQFVVESRDYTMTGLVSGIDLGANTLSVRLPGDRDPYVELMLQNHPIEGPVFSGPHEQPFFCETKDFTIPVIGESLGPPLDENCSVDTRIDYFYRTTEGTFAVWPADSTGYPDDLAFTTTTLGKRVPYIVRMETGTVNRSIYQTTILDDPLAESEPSWRTPPTGWNKRLIYSFGGGCINGWYRQGSAMPDVTDNFMLSHGYAVASASLNVFGNNCSDLTAAETMMMVKERFVEAHGLMAHTQGFGASGGAYQQVQIADNYPGLLDGILPGLSFPEVGFATIHFITDAWLLDNYFTTRAAGPWTAEQKRQVTGFGVYNTAPNVAVGARRIDPRGDINHTCGAVPQNTIYDPATNPGGVRCDYYDHLVNVFGRDANTGFALRPLDNVGIQYGLKALNDGVITVDQFLDLNEKIGGFDHDANILSAGRRTIADIPAVRASYQTGRLTNGEGGLASIPIIDHRAYTDRGPFDDGTGDIHLRYHSFSIRERLEKANGRSDNLVMVVRDPEGKWWYSTEDPLLQRMILALDRWITAIKHDKRNIPDIEKVVQNKPAAIQEGCLTRDASPTFIAEHLTRDPSSKCEQLYPTYSFPREVAGADVSSDIIKCQIKSPKPSDYAVLFAPQQWDRLQSIFPTGVCDWSQPGVEQQGLTGTWIRFPQGRPDPSPSTQDAAPLTSAP